MKKTLLLKAVAVAAALSLGGIALSAVVPPGTLLSDKQELVRNNASESETLDPAVAESVGANNICRDLFEGLTAADNNSKIVPGVAESWKQVDATTWVFKLRKDAVFSNGNPITAADFVYSWQRFLSPKTASTYSTTYGIFFVNGLEIAKGQKQPTELGVRAVDKYTLEVKTVAPTPFLPELLSNTQFAPVDKSVVEKHAKDWTKPGNMVGNGAYVLKEWQDRKSVV